MDSNTVTTGQKKTTDSVGSVSPMTDTETVPAVDVSTDPSGTNNLGSANSPQEMAQDSLQAVDPAEPETDLAATPDTSTASPVSKPKTPASSSKSAARHRATFEAPEDLPQDFPDEEANLNPEQIAKLFYQSLTQRKKYHRYFNASGRARRPLYKFIFERLPDGELKHPETIIRSNVMNWQNQLLYFEHPKEYDAKGRLRKERAQSTRDTERMTELGHASNDRGKMPETSDDAVENSPPAELEEQEPLSATTMQPMATALPKPSPKNVNSHGANAPLTATEPASRRLVTHTLVPALELPLAAHEGSSVSPPPRPRPGPFSTPVSGELPAVPPKPLSDLVSDPFSLVDERNDLPETNPVRDYQLQPLAAEQHVETEGHVQDEQRESDPASKADQELAPLRQYLNADLCRFIQRFEAGDLNLLKVEDLAGFNQWINIQVSQLNANLMDASKAGQSQRYRRSLNEIMMKLLTLQNSCYDLEEQLKTARMADE